VVEAHEHVDRRLARADRAAEALDPRGQPGRVGRDLEERLELAREAFGVREREEIGVGLDEEVERVDDRHVGDQVDR
jgi:hypothetical protein